MTAGVRLQIARARRACDGFARPYRPAGGAGTDHVFKILVTGPFAAGKTSLIQSVSQSPVVSTDVATSGDESMVKALTTVALDFGTFRIDGGGDEVLTSRVEGVQLLLFGTPGQERFWFMTDVLKGDVDVVVFVVDAEAEHTHAEAGAAMRALLKDLRVPLVVAVNRCDDADRGDDARPLARSAVVRAGRPLPADRSRERPRRRDRGPADAARVDGRPGVGLALRGTDRWWVRCDVRGADTRSAQIRRQVAPPTAARSAARHSASAARRVPIAWPAPSAAARRRAIARPGLRGCRSIGRRSPTSSSGARSWTRSSSSGRPVRSTSSSSAGHSRRCRRPERRATRRDPTIRVRGSPRPGSRSRTVLPMRRDPAWTDRRASDPQLGPSIRLEVADDRRRHHTSRIDDRCRPLAIATRLRMDRRRGFIPDRVDRRARRSALKRLIGGLRRR